MQNRSPIQVWTSERIDIRNRQLINVSKLQSIDETVHEMDDIEQYGMDWGAPAPTDDGLSTAEVNKIEVATDDIAREQLSQINPLAESSSFGIDIYIRPLKVFHP